ncbi:Hpt domain-containing protein, partial [bacterium AH-315-P15]|nr:Hpt domain-containing protein [bacterium AH-315-P15]
MGNYETIDGGPLPIDLEHLSQYTADDAAVTRDVLTIFRDQAEGWLAAMGEAGDLQAWLDAAHTMKGAARGVGAPEIAQLAKEAEAVSALETPERAEVFARLE